MWRLTPFSVLSIYFFFLLGMKIVYLLSSVILVEFLNTSSKEFVTTNDFFSRIASPSPGSWARNERTWKRIWKSFRLSQKLNPIPSHLVVNATKYTLEFLVSNIWILMYFIFLPLNYSAILALELDSNSNASMI